MVRCHDDLEAITKYVTWNLNERGSNALSRVLPDQADIISVYRVALESTGGEAHAPEEPTKEQTKDNKKEKSVANPKQQPLTPIPPNTKLYAEREYRNLLKLMEETFVSRDESRTNIVVGALVQHIVTQWRLQFCNSVISKFNCYFMMPFADDFNLYVRKELQKLYEEEENSFSDVFDVVSARRTLEKTRDDLMSECVANKRLQDKFRLCSQVMNT
jgi:hypothetical protein